MSTRSSINEHTSLFSFERRDEQADAFPDNVGPRTTSRRKKKKETNYSRVFFAIGGKRNSVARRPSICERADCDTAVVTGYWREFPRVTSRKTEKEKPQRRRRTGQDCARWIQVDNAHGWEADMRRTSARTLVGRRRARRLCLPVRSRLLITQCRARRGFCWIRGEHASGDSHLGRTERINKTELSDTKRPRRNARFLSLSL